MRTLHGKSSGHDVSLSESNPVVVHMLGFVRTLRGQGYPVGIREELDALRVAECCGLLDRQRLRWGLRSLLCGNASEWQRFDHLFDAYWSASSHKTRSRSSNAGRLEGKDSIGGATGRHEVAETDQTQSGDETDCTDGGVRRGASRQESSLRSDFRFLSDEQQMRAVEALVDSLARRMWRRLRRRMRILRRGRRVHVRRTIHRSLQYGGAPMELVFMQRRRTLPRLIVLLDVSRSMSLYSYLFLRFARGIVRVFPDAHAFVYHTRLVPVTDALRERDSGKLRDKLAMISLGWSGGTRIGECLQAFNRRHGASIVNSRSVVVIVSDGLDTGPPELLAAHLAYIKQRARTIIWLNPLLGRDGYEPVARGMAAAMPFIDVFAPAHNLDSLAALEVQLAKAC
ncbi:vWA domain-containing protein [Petrachloros mirabilis]